MDAPSDGHPDPFVVRPFTADDVDAVQAMLDDDDVLAFTPIPEPLPPAHAARWLGLPSWVAVRGGVVAGVGMCPSSDVEKGEYELGYVVAREHRGRGVGPALLPTDDAAVALSGRSPGAAGR